MPLKRTPPTTPNMSKSDTDLSIPRTEISSEDLLHNITTRHKRPRQGSSSPTQVNQFSSELREMMEALHTSSINQQKMMNKLIEEVAEIKKQNIKIQKSNVQIENTLESLKNSNENMLKRIQLLEKERFDQQNYIVSLEKKIENMQQTSRPSNVEIRNVPAVQEESFTDLTAHLQNIGQALHVEIQPSDIRDTYRIGKNKIIVAEFQSVHLKNKVLAAARKYNKDHSGDQRLNTSNIGLAGDPTPIYISEYLAGSNRKLFYEAREYAKANNYKFCWTGNGNIYMKKDEQSKAIRVDSEITLNSLLTKQ